MDVNYVAVVQLEERFPAKEEVIGSNPIGYTIFLLLIGFSPFGLTRIAIQAILPYRLHHIFPVQKVCNL